MFGSHSVRLAHAPPEPAVHTLLVQTLPEAQLPQLSVAEQLSLIVPQFLPDAEHVVGTQAATHWNEALHWLPEVQLPQLSEPPQPLLGAPQATAAPPMPALLQVLAGQLDVQVFDEVQAEPVR